MIGPGEVKRTRHQYHHGDLRPALLEAVAAVIRERGAANVSLREAARRAGVSHGAPAHHFGSKAGLLTAFATQGYERLAETVLDAVAESAPADGPGVLEAIGLGYVRFALANPERFDVMFRLDLLNVGDADFVAAGEGAYALLVSTIERCAEEGRLDGHDPEVVAVAAWSLVHGLSALWISGRLSERIRETDPSRLAASVARLFVGALMPDPSSPRTTLTP
jgi:AcrR family transcriptional regulator